MASSNPSWSLLPFELVENILYNVPVASLVRFMSTCKQWYALLNDKRFIYKHLELSREGLIRVHDDKLCQFINFETLSLSNLQGPSYIISIIHCDGLLLCECRLSFSSGCTNTKIAVWNPFLNQIKWINALKSIKGHYGKYGLGYDNASRDEYKILRFCNKTACVEVEIYEFKTQLWRRVDYSRAYSWYVGYNEAVSMGGNMYWFGEKHNIDKSINEYFIQSFDFSREIFEETCCIPFLTCHDDWHLPRLQGLGGDRLCLLAEHRFGKIQVWVTNKVTDEVVSWSKYFNVTPPIISRGLCNTTFFIHKINMIMLWCEEAKQVGQNINTYVNVYKISEGVVEKLVETGRYRGCDKRSMLSRCCVFVPSLVPVLE